MTPSARDQSRLRLCVVEQQPSSTRPLNTLCCTSLKYRDEVVDISTGHHPAEVVYK
jgi:hypothetical protein